MLAQGGPFDALNACLYRACRDAQGRPFHQLCVSFFVRLFFAFFALFRGYSSLCLCAFVCDFTGVYSWAFAVIFCVFCAFLRLLHFFLHYLRKSALICG
jgi:hypothetical protein